MQGCSKSDLFSTQVRWGDNCARLVLRVFGPPLFFRQMVCRRGGLLAWRLILSPWRCCGSGLPLRAGGDQAHGVGVLHLYIFVALHTYIYATLQPLIGAGLRACCICCTCCTVFLEPKYLHSLALVCIMPPAYLFHCFLAGLLSYRGTFRGTVFSARHKSPVPCGLQLDSMVPSSYHFQAAHCAA